MIWVPQPGPQSVAAVSNADFTFFGGTRGGGKSDCLIGRQIRGAEKHGEAWNGLILRRKYKDFAEVRRRIRELIVKGLPAELEGGDQQKNILKFKNGARVTLVAINRLEMVDDFQGHQYTEISIDEAPNFPFLAQMIEKLKGCLRSPHGVPCRMFLTGNPGGPGHNIAKTLFIVPHPNGNRVFYDEAGESYVFIPSSLSDNKILCQNDPKYVNRLRSIKDPVLRRAWLEGDWDAFIGQAFQFSTQYHVIPPCSPPLHAPLYMTFDWGYGKPFSIGWWFTDEEGRLYRFGEWYGVEPGRVDVGIRMTDRQIADGILEREEKLGIRGREIRRLSDPTCFNKKPNYQSPVGAPGPSTAEEFAAKGLYLTPGDPTRTTKIRQFRERLVIPEVVGGRRPMPMLVVTENCKHFIRTIPSLCMDEDKPEDIDTDQEDHVYDEACHVVMARPLSLVEPQRPVDEFTSRIDKLMQPEVQDEFEEAVLKEGGHDPWGQAEATPDTYETM